MAEFFLTEFEVCRPNLNNSPGPVSLYLWYTKVLLMIFFSIVDEVLNRFVEGRKLPRHFYFSLHTQKSSAPLSVI